MVLLQSSEELEDEAVYELIEETAQRFVGFRVLRPKDKERMIKEVFNGIRKMDLLEELLEQQDITEIMLNSYDNIFVERNTSTATKISMLKKFFKAYGANPEDLLFYLKDETNSVKVEEAGTRYVLRRRYWAFALPYIQQAHGSHGSYSNSTSSKENWLSGFFGISGFNISCVANYDCARVEIVLFKPLKETNKEAFDFLFGHKEKIETALGTSLNWLRSDDTKSSYVTIRLENVSIENETDWTQMAKFHAEWSKKFYDVFVPYLKQKY